MSQDSSQKKRVRVKGQLIVSVYLYGPEDLQTLRRAAKLRGVGYTVFMREAALKEAGRVLGGEKKRARAAA